MGFSTKECAWAQAKVTVLGRVLVGITGFEYKKTVEKEVIYGAGNKPIDIQTGNEKIEGSLKLLKYEVDMMNEAARAAGFTGGIIDVPHEAVQIQVTYQKTATSSVVNEYIAGVAFTELPAGMDQGAKLSEITLPFIAMQMW